MMEKVQKFGGPKKQRREQIEDSEFNNYIPQHRNEPRSNTCLEKKRRSLQIKEKTSVQFSKEGRKEV